MNIIGTLVAIAIVVGWLVAAFILSLEWLDERRMERNYRRTKLPTPPSSSHRVLAMLRAALRWAGGSSLRLT